MTAIPATPELTVHDEDTWRISQSGFSIKVGWGDDKRIVAAYPGGATHPIDTKLYEQWLTDAQKICDDHNTALTQQSELTRLREANSKQVEWIADLQADIARLRAEIAENEQRITRYCKQSIALSSELTALRAQPHERMGDK